MRGTFDLNGSFKEGMAPSRKGAKIKHSCRLLCLIAAAKCGQGQNRRLGNSLESVENPALSNVIMQLSLWGYLHV